MRWLSPIGVFTFAIFFFSCTLFKKNIPAPVTVAFIQGNSSASLYSSAYNTKYINLVTEEDIYQNFLDNFKQEAYSTKNITLTDNENNADFVLRLKSLSVNESSRTEKVNDTKSPYNGMEVVLNSVECSVEFEITNTKSGNKKLLNCHNSKLRSEKLKNNRDIGDLITGTNKDRTEYKTKLLSDRICIQLAQDVGRRIWAPITRRIARNL